MRITRRALLAATATAVLVAGVPAVAQMTDDNATTSEPSEQSEQPPEVVPRRDRDVRLVNFRSVCNFSHRADDDPIMHPGQGGASHSHDFFGATTTDADSTVESPQADGTTCHRLNDTSAYWVPTLIDGGVQMRPSRASAYYLAVRKDPESIEPFPPGLKIIAGGPDAVRWACKSGHQPVRGQPEVPDCGQDEELVLRVRFPECWNGQDLDSADHRSHMAYSQDGQCPASHPVPMPELLFTVRYPDSDGGDDLELSGGPVFQAHADFFSAWQPDAQERLVEECLNAGHRCGLGGADAHSHRDAFRQRLMEQPRLLRLLRALRDRA